MVRSMRWDRHTLMAFGGIAALVIGGLLLLEDARPVFVPVIGMVAGIAAMARASHERLKQRMEALESGWRSENGGRDRRCGLNSLRANGFREREGIAPDHIYVLVC